MRTSRDRSESTQVEGLRQGKNVLPVINHCQSDTISSVGLDTFNIYYEA
jgi:hypothetical protein